MFEITIIFVLPNFRICRLHWKLVKYSKPHIIASFPIKTKKHESFSPWGNEFNYLKILSYRSLSQVSIWRCARLSLKTKWTVFFRQVIHGMSRGAKGYHLCIHLSKKNSLFKTMLWKMVCQFIPHGIRHFPCGSL